MGRLDRNVALAYQKRRTHRFGATREIEDLAARRLTPDCARWLSTGDQRLRQCSANTQTDNT